MPLTAYTFDPALAARYVDLCFSLYRGDPNWIPPLRRRLLGQLAPACSFYGRPGNAHRNFLLTTGDAAVGHVAALVNGRLRDSDGTAVGMVGFFECIDDPAAAAELLGAAREWLRTAHGRRRIWGPMQFDIWHGYRLMTRGFEEPTFPGEPYNKPYYPGLFEQQGFTVRKRWYSVEFSGATALHALLRRSEEAQARALEDGYRFDRMDLGDPALRPALHRAIEDSYRGFLGMTSLEREEFDDVFASHARAVDSRLTVAAWAPNGDLAGFAIAYPDYGAAQRAMRGRESVLARLRFYLAARGARRAVFYMIGIAGRESSRGRGLGRALQYECLRSMMSLGFDRVLFALLADDSRGWTHLGDRRPRAQKEYALYEVDTPC